MGKQLLPLTLRSRPGERRQRERAAELARRTAWPDSARAASWSPSAGVGPRAGRCPETLARCLFLVWSFSSLTRACRSRDWSPAIPDLLVRITTYQGSACSGAVFAPLHRATAGCSSVLSGTQHRVMFLSGARGGMTEVTLRTSGLRPRPQFFGDAAPVPGAAGAPCGPESHSGAETTRSFPDGGSSVGQ